MMGIYQIYCRRQYISMKINQTYCRRQCSITSSIVQCVLCQWRSLEIPEFCRLLVIFRVRRLRFSTAFTWSNTAFLTEEQRPHGMILRTGVKLTPPSASRESLLNYKPSPSPCYHYISDDTQTPQTPSLLILQTRTIPGCVQNQSGTSFFYGYPGNMYLWRSPMLSRESLTNKIFWFYRNSIL